MKYVSAFFLHIALFFATTYLFYWVASKQPWDRAGDIFLTLSTLAALLSGLGFLVASYLSRRIVVRIARLSYLIVAGFLGLSCGFIDLVLFFASPNLMLVFFYILIPIIAIMPLLALVENIEGKIRSASAR